MRRMTPDGFADEKQAASYFQEKEEMLEEIVRTLDTVEDAMTTEAEGVKDAVKSMRESLRHLESGARQLTRKDVETELGKALCAAWTGDRNTLGELKCVPNLKSENWNNPSDFQWTREKGFVLRKKDTPVEPMGNMATNEQYLINPIYESVIMEDAARKSVMMDLVNHIPMKGPSIWIPERDRGGVSLKWLTQYGAKIEGSKPSAPTRKELKAYTLAGFIPWYDEFEEDVFADLGKLFMSEFTESYGIEFDRQCLVADASPFTGIMADGNATRHRVDCDIKKLSYIDFRDAEIKVPAEERKSCMWFFSESILNRITNITDDEGNPIWRRPGDSMPGLVDGYRYQECSLLPGFADVGENTPFAVFMDPRRIIHGNRKGIEIKRFEGTTESLENGELFMRFRKRDGFMISRSKGNIVVMQTEAS
ncbi:MAG: phage major capsid protein [Treponemataceae bacterium]|nr:phage major capsid protein [Treponemataceae bacterium]